MLVSCPSCKYSREIDPKIIPPGVKTAKCPKCGGRFALFGTGEEIKKTEPPQPQAPESQAAPPPAATPETSAGKPAPSQSCASNEARPEGAGEKPAPKKPPVPAQGQQAAQTPPVSQTPAKTLGAIPPPNPDAKVGTALSGNQLLFTGYGLELLGIYFLNSLLTILTFGVYHFWGKAKVRGYIYGSTELLYERFVYTGTGKELFLGWIKGVIILFVVFGIPKALAFTVNPAFAILSLPASLLLVPFVLVSAKRYRLSRTTWHGVNFSFKGTVGGYFRLFLKGGILTFLTLGFYAPYYHAKKQAFWRTNTRYGTGAFTYTGQGRDLKKDYIKAAFLGIITLGLAWFWYWAKLTRYDWEHTSFGDVKFSYPVEGWDLFLLHAGNMLILVLTLGLGYSWTVVRKIRFTADRLSFMGIPDFAALKQGPKDARAVGDEIAGILDIDMAI